MKDGDSVLGIETTSATSPASVNAVLDTSTQTATVVFWDSVGGSANLPFDGAGNPVANVAPDHALTIIVPRGMGIVASDLSDSPERGGDTDGRTWVGTGNTNAAPVSVWRYWRSRRDIWDSLKA
jgi:hypothetical protein